MRRTMKPMQIQHRPYCQRSVTIGLRGARLFVTQVGYTLVRKDVGATDTGVVVLSHERFRPTSLLSRPNVHEIFAMSRQMNGQSVDIDFGQD